MNTYPITLKNARSIAGRVQDFFRHLREKIAERGAAVLRMWKVCRTFAGMKRLKESLCAALGGRYAGDELPAVVRALCLEGLGLGTAAVYLDEPVTLSEPQQAWLTQAVRRLQAGEPLQYVLGTAPFAGLELKVDRRVLIPRPETAELVAETVSKARQANKSPVRILDVGTGSGCIAIALAKALKEAEVTALDVSEDALDVARDNAERAGARVQFVRADVLSASGQGESLLLEALPKGCACIVSNPPYVRECERMAMDERVTAWEPPKALFVPDDDPLVFYRALARLGQTEVLADGGWIAVEINSAFGRETATLFRLWGYRDVALKEDMYGKPRIVIGRKRGLSGLRSGQGEDADADVGDSA